MTQEKSLENETLIGKINSTKEQILTIEDSIRSLSNLNSSVKDIPSYMRGNINEVVQYLNGHKTRLELNKKTLLDLADNHYLYFCRICDSFYSLVQLRRAVKTIENEVEGKNEKFTYQDYEEFSCPKKHLVMYVKLD